MSAKVLGVLGGRGVVGPDLARWAERADVLYGADSGADVLLEAGFAPTLVGDLDSVRPGSADRCPRVLSRPDQESSDCDKLLRAIADDGHDSALLANVEGGLVDHFLGVLFSAARSPVPVRFVFGEGLGWLVRSGEPVEVETGPERRVSLMPITACAGATLRGVAWEFVDADLAPDGLVSLSNRSVQASVRASVASGAALLVVRYEKDEMPIW